ncbi:MAG: hypothetical protein K2X38_16575 [Gemmataceae bacterium]|nr:hypothetical protein [Gemmataceae bacterium]
MNASATIHEAALASGPSGAVECGQAISLDETVARRIIGLDVCVCGPSTDENRRTARSIESEVGPCVRQDPHGRAGPHALPHFQPRTRLTEGHAFYETDRRKAKKGSS